jgi:DNA (cytosine-5)-methyltransferase 1
MEEKLIKELDKNPTQTRAVISFFSGCGGFDLGFSSAGFSIKLALDLDSKAVKSYNYNRALEVCEVADLSKVNSAEIIEMYNQKCPNSPPLGVIGGAPCQTFSNGNVHFNANDPRHMLPRRYASLLRTINKEHKLDFFIFENVKGIKSARHRREYTTIKMLFSRAGFKLFEGELDAADYGVPQHRSRVFIVGFNKTKYPTIKFSFPKPETLIPLTVESKLKGLPPPVLFRKGLKVEDIGQHPNHWAMSPRSRRFFDGTLQKGSKNGRSFRVLQWDKPSYTIAYGNREVHIHPNTKRRISVYEAMLLQGFPKEFILLGTLSDQIRQVSDAIPPQLGEVLGRAIIDAIYKVK